MAQSVQVVVSDTDLQCILVNLSVLVDHGITDVSDCLNESFGFEKNLFSSSLSFKDECLFLTLGDVDLRVHVTFRCQDSASLNTLALGLQLHGSLDSLRRLDVFDFISHAVDAPLLTRIIEGRTHLIVQTSTLLERRVQVKLADLATHRGLGQQGESLDGLGHRVGRFVGIADPEVENSINLDFHVVSRDRILLVHVQDLLFQRVVVGDCLDEGDFEIEAGFHDAAVVAELLDDELVLLRHHHEW